tara:strand:+ start:732 stop:1079 length:348 start_codon:yes stop_codon:yes gene_type:complete
MLENMIFYGYHGNKSEERSLGQRFSVTVILHCRLEKAGRSDSLDDTVDYGLAYTAVKKVMEGPSLNLLETCAEQISTSLLATSDLIEQVQVVIRKPSVPIAGPLDSAVVSITRTQ